MSTQIQDILNIPDTEWSAMPEEQRKKLLDPLIPIVRRPNKEAMAKEVDKQLERLGKLLGL